MNLRSIFFAFIAVFFYYSPVNSQELSNRLADLDDGMQLEFNEQIMTAKEITISGKKDINILGGDKAEIVTFNSEPHVLKFVNCKNIKIENVKIRFGIKGVGGPVLIFENSNDVTLTDLNLGGFGEMAVFIDSSSSDIKILNSSIHDCREMGIQSHTASLEIRECSFESNSTIGRFKPDLDIILEEGYPNIRFNNYRVSEYIKHKTTVDEFVSSRNTVGYNFDCFKIVKKYELNDGAAGKVTAFYEGENNKILDKMQCEYKGSKGTVSATAYFLHGNLVFTNYEIKKGKIDLNYFVYGDFLEHLEKANAKAAPHVSGNPQSNRKQFTAWLSAIDSWKDYLFNEAEEWELYENKANFIALPY